MENTCNNAIVRLSFLFFWTIDEFLTEEAAQTHYEMSFMPSQ